MGTLLVIFIVGIVAYGIHKYGPTIVRDIKQTIKWNRDKF